MATLKELQEKAKVAALAASLSAVPAYGSSPDDTPSDMKFDSTRKEIIVENPETYITLREQTSVKLSEQLENPVSEENKTLSVEETYIGPFTGIGVMEELDEKRGKYKSNTTAYPLDVEQGTRVINNVEDYKELNDLAYYDQSDKKVHLFKYDLSDDFRKLYNEKVSEPCWTKGILNNASIYTLTALKHEGAHFEHEARGQGSPELGSANMCVDREYVTEKVAYSTQVLALANIWKQCHDAGMEKYQLEDGKNVDLNDMLLVVPGLKEELEKNGFDPKSEKSKSNVVKIASEHWDKYFLPAYSERQFSQIACGANSIDNMMNQIKNARNQEKILTDMTKNLDIGYGMRVDIPKDCVPLLLPKHEITQQIVSNAEQDFSPSTKGLLAIDKHLDDIGIKNDKDKDAYLKEQYTKIINRDPSADLALKELMLNAGSENNKTIVYSDNLLVKNIDGISTVSNDAGKTSYALTPMDKYIDNKANENQTAYSKENTKENTEKESKAFVITPSMIKQQTTR